MKRIIHLIYLVLFVLMANSSALFAQNESLHQELIQQLKGRDRQIKDLLKDQEGDQLSDEMKEQLMNLINNTIDFMEMGKMALADQINLFSEVELNEFYELFASMIRANSVKNLDIYRATIEYEGVKEETDKQLIVQTVSSLDNVSTPVYYTYVSTNKGWVIADFAIDNASTAMSYQRSFSRLISKRGVEGLLKVLRKKADQTQ